MTRCLGHIWLECLGQMRINERKSLHAGPMKLPDYSLIHMHILGLTLTYLLWPYFGLLFAQDKNSVRYKYYLVSLHCDKVT